MYRRTLACYERDMNWKTIPFILKQRLENIKTLNKSINFIDDQNIDEEITQAAEFDDRISNKSIMNIKVELEEEADIRNPLTDQENKT